MKKHLELLRTYKKVCVTGNIGSDHFQYAQKLAKQLVGNEADSNIHIIQFNQNTAYENLIYGTTVSTYKDAIQIVNEEKELVNLIRQAQGTSKPTVIILKDINIVNLYHVFGDAIGILKGDHVVHLNNLTSLTIPENIYWIATETPLYSMEQFKQSSYPYFYAIDLMEDEVAVHGVLTTLEEMKAFFEVRLDMNEPIENVEKCYELYKTINHDIIDANFMLPGAEKRNYYIGRHYFYDNSIEQKIKNNLVAVLTYYVKQGVLQMDAFNQIESYTSNDIVSTEYNTLEDLDIAIVPSNEKSYVARINTMVGQNIKHFSNYYLKHTGQIDLDVSNVMKLDSSVDLPFALIVQLLELNLISNKEMFAEILYNPKFYTYPNSTQQNAFLFSNYEKYMHIASNGLDKMVDVYRSTNGVLEINEIKYGVFNHFAIHNGGINFKANRIESKNQRYLRINDVIYYILYYFYNCYIQNLKLLDDENSKNLAFYVEGQFKQFEDHIKAIDVSNYKKPDGKYKNFKGLELESYLFKLLKFVNDDLKILQMNIGDEIEYNGEKIILKGAYKLGGVDYLNIMNKLGIRQMILQGPPGTSKTYTTKQLIESVLKTDGMDSDQLNSIYKSSQFSKVLEEKATRFESFKTQQHALINQLKENNQKEQADSLLKELAEKEKECNLENQKVIWDIVQFHPSYTYEDFIRGIRVETTDGQASYSTVNKILGEMAAYAAANQETKFFLVVDEINRANLATVFGELIYGLEYRNQSVATPYKVNDNYGINLPTNLYIIGTMNTADKSVGSIDYAIRRRFLFFDLLASAEVVEKEYEDVLEKETTNSLKLFKALKQFFVKCTSKDYRLNDVQIGHTYFLTKQLLEDADVSKLSKEALHEKITDVLFTRFEYQIVPILREYAKDGILQERALTEEDVAYKQLFKLLRFEQELKTKKVFENLIDLIADEKVGAEAVGTSSN